jgi:hypothetical protein
MREADEAYRAHRRGFEDIRHKQFAGLRDSGKAESIRDAERTESAKTGASTAQFGSCGGRDLTGRLVGNPTNARIRPLSEDDPDF